MPDFDPLNLISLQPFYGGSHRSFIDGWIQHSGHHWTQLTLPPRHWKWRMRHAAVYFAAQVDRMWNDGKRWDSFFTTDMLNVAEFRGLLKTEAKHVPVGVYFHENQIAYPNQNGNPRDLHFTFTNLTSILAADFTWFNSEFNRTSMVTGLLKASKHWPDFAPQDEIKTISSRTQIAAPGIDIAPLHKRSISTARTGPIHLVWAARWEHDKNPKEFFDALRELKNQYIPFNLILLGKASKHSPACFKNAIKEFKNNILFILK